MSHKDHPICEFTSKVACEKARRIAIGQCSAMIDETRQCDHWGVDTVEDRGYCGQHINSVYLEADRTSRRARTRTEQEARIDAALAWHAQHPSVWDLLPA